MRATARHHPSKGAHSKTERVWRAVPVIGARHAYAFFTPEKHPDDNRKHPPDAGPPIVRARTRPRAPFPPRRAAPSFTAPAPSRAAAHLATPPSPSDAPGSGPTPTAALLDAMPVADATFARTACETVYVLDYSPLARDVPSELASSYPGRVAKPAARVLQKLNLADAVLAADGADAAILLKLLASLGGGDACRAAVIRRPHLMPPAALRAFAGGAAATDAPVDVRCAPGTAEDAATDLRSVLPSASFEEEEAAAEGEDAASFAVAVASRVAAVEAEDAVAGAPDWLGEDAPTYVARVAFVHDRASKQVAQLVEDVTERARESARRREATKTEERGEGSGGGGSGGGGSGDSAAAAATSAAAAAEDSSDDAKTSKRDEADAPPSSALISCEASCADSCRARGAAAGAGGRQRGGPGRDEAPVDRDVREADKHPGDPPQLRSQQRQPRDRAGPRQVSAGRARLGRLRTPVRGDYGRYPQASRSARHFRTARV